MVARTIVQRIPIFGDSFAPDADVLAEFTRWDEEDAEEAEADREEKEAMRRIRKKGVTIKL